MSPWLSDLFLRSQTDERLVALARDGQERAFTAIVDRYRRPLLAHARCLDPGRDEDLVQQTFVSALTALRTGTEVRHLRGWLYEILRNLATRRPGAVSAELRDAEPQAESAQQVAERRMLALDALAALAQLPPRQHHALLQVAIHGRSGSEVAETMGMTEGAVRQLVHRARAGVRAAVTAITPFALVRWVSTSRSATAARLADVTVTGGAGSTAVIGGVKLGVGALMATGIVAGGVISTGALHQDRSRHRPHPLAAQVSAGGARARGGDQEERAVAIASRVGAPSPRPDRHSGVGDRSDAGRQTVGGSTGSSGAQGGAPGSGSRGSSGSDRSEGSDRPSETGGSGGSSGPGPGDHSGGDSDRGGTSPGSDGDGGGAGSGTDGGGGPGPTTATTSDGRSGGSDGGSSGSGETGSSGSGDGSSSSDSGSAGGPGSPDGGQHTVSGGSGGPDRG